MSIDVFVHFDGNCREAVEFYAKVFGSEKPKIMSYGEAPPDPDFPISEDAKNLVLFTFLNINGNRVMFSDVPPGMPFTAGNNISLVINGKEKNELKSIFEQLEESGKVSMELQETFWSKYYGMLTDKFGISWQFNYNGE